MKYLALLVLLFLLERFAPAPPAPSTDVRIQANIIEGSNKEPSY